MNWNCALGQRHFDSDWGSDSINQRRIADIQWPN